VWKWNTFKCFFTSLSWIDMFFINCLIICPSFNGWVSNHLILDHITNTVTMLNDVAMMQKTFLEICCKPSIGHTKKNLIFKKLSSSIIMNFLLTLQIWTLLVYRPINTTLNITKWIFEYVLKIFHSRTFPTCVY
jgi:hypothetical protein